MFIDIVELSVYLQNVVIREYDAVKITRRHHCLSALHSRFNAGCLSTSHGLVLVPLQPKQLHVIPQDIFLPKFVDSKAL